MLQSKLSELILDCFFFVYKQFGYGFLESVYANALEADERQLLNYLKATPIEVGFLLHFGPKPKFLRRVLVTARKRSGIASD